MGKVDDITVRSENKIGGEYVDGKCQTFEFCRIANAKNIASFVFPRKSNLVDKSFDSGYIGSANACVCKEIGSGSSESNQWSRNQVVKSGRAKDAGLFDRITGKTV
jgi:hypothetical protein